MVFKAYMMCPTTNFNKIHYGVQNMNHTHGHITYFVNAVCINDT